MINTILDELLDRWRGAGVPINNGVSIGALEAAEASLSCKLPEDFIAYLRTVDGMSSGNTDESMISFLSLDEILANSIMNKNNNHNDIVFAEYMIYSHYYLLRVADGGTEVGVYAADGQHEQKLCDTLRQFIEWYLSTPDAVAHCLKRA